MKISHLRLP